jgi:hypothetical protein
MDHLLPDTMYEILLNSDLETITKYCMTHKNNKCDSHFWKKKLNGKVDIGQEFPSIYIDEFRTLEHYLDNLEVNIEELPKTLYEKMKFAQKQAKNVMIINKIEKTRDHNHTDGIMKIYPYDNHEDLGADGFINLLPKIDIPIDNYSPHLIKMTLLDNHYKFEYTVLDRKTEDFETFDKIITEKEMLVIITLFIFDRDTLYYNEIMDDHYQPFLLSHYNPGINTPLGRKGIWDTLKFFNL